MRLLLHICCGPCALVPMRALQKEGHEVAGAFVNSNIHPYVEYVRRLDAAREAADALGVPIVHESGYGLEEFLEAVMGSGAPEEKEARCRICYSTRLDRAAELARSLGFDGFTTSMLVSTHQDHEGIREAGEAAASKHGVEFVYRDFRPAVMEGVRQSKDMNLYRQQYCGCIFSEWERYRESSAERGGGKGSE